MRLFVAAELPEPVVDALVGWVPDHEALRRVPRQSLHVTLAFLGERDESIVPVLRALLGELARPVAGLVLGRARWLPPRRPRVLAVELAGADALVELQAALAEALAEAVDHVPERRRFLPHVTVARTRSAPVPEELADVPDAGVFAATSLTLFRSRLSPKGADYEALARASLDVP